MGIPVVDCTGGIKTHSWEIMEAINDIGFVYLRNHGLEKSLVTAAFTAGDAFWALPESARSHWARSSESAAATGWVPQGAEALDPDKRRELRQAFDLVPPLSRETLPPNAGFADAVLGLYAGASRIAWELVEAIGAGFLPTRPQCLSERHRGLRSGEGTSILRLLHYPPVGNQEATRCGEHTDYGTLTLLFQDSLGGLEVLGKNGEWLDAQPVEDAILVNAGDLLVGDLISSTADIVEELCESAMRSLS